MGAAGLGVHGAGLSGASTGPSGPGTSDQAVPPPLGAIPPGLTRRILAVELLIVLSLSFLPSAFDSLISLLTAPLSGVSVFLYSNVRLVQQVVDILFALAPVALVLYLVSRNGEGAASIGLGTGTVTTDVRWGVALGLAVSAVGLGVYLGSLALKINRFVVPVPPLGHWWTIPVLVLGAAQAALLEEVIVAGYLIHRLEQLGWAGLLAVVASAALRGSYHLYQGWGGFAGNFALGLAFAYSFRRWRRTWPLVTAHFVIDTLAGVGYIIFRGHCLGGVCVR